MDETCPNQELLPQSPYAEFKLKSEQMLQEMGRNQGLKYVTCRFGTIFGTSIGMRFHTAVNKFCWQAVMGQPLTVWKTALDQKRPYLSVHDAIRAIRYIVKNDIFDGEIYNIVSSNNTVRDIVDAIRKSIPELEVDLVETEIMNQLSYEVLSDKIKKHGFSINDQLKDGVAETISLIQN